MHSSAYGKHNVAIFESVHHSILNLSSSILASACNLFLKPLLTVQIDLSIAATLQGCNFKNF